MCDRAKSNDQQQPGSADPTAASNHNHNQTTLQTIFIALYQEPATHLNVH
jgi:hypothetical protein